MPLDKEATDAELDIDFEPDSKICYSLNDGGDLESMPDEPQNNELWTVVIFKFVEQAESDIRKKTRIDCNTLNKWTTVLDSVYLCQIWFFHLYFSATS